MDYSRDFVFCFVGTLIVIFLVINFAKTISKILIVLAMVGGAYMATKLIAIGFAWYQSAIIVGVPVGILCIPLSLVEDFDDFRQLVLPSIKKDLKEEKGHSDSSSD